ncbi:MAG TPA: type II toxin-antitoxin system RelE/ParE family toxin [Myxococcota bacterium]|jgi:phage-related protein
MPKPVTFLGSSLHDLRDFPHEARRDAGFQLDKVQRGLLPDDWKPIATMPSGVQEIRVRDGSGIYRVVYVATFSEAVYVLHAFQKKVRKISRADLAVVRRRYDELIWSRR